MASLNGQTPANTYEGLLKTNDNGTLPSGADPAESITDGAGNASNLKLHQDKVDFDRIEINGNDGVQGDYLKNNGSGNLVWSQDGLAPSGYDWANTAINNRINGVESDRIHGDNWLKGYIDTEISTRTSADATLQSNIDAEASTRASADTTLQSNIDTKESLSNKNMFNGYAGLDQFGQIANAQIPVNLGNHSINNLTVLSAGEFQSNVDFEGNVDFEDVVNFYDNVTVQGSGTAIITPTGGSEFLTLTKFKNAAVRIEAGMEFLQGLAHFSSSQGVRFSSPLRDYYGNLPSANSQALVTIGNSGYVQWQNVGGAGTTTGTYTVQAKTADVGYSPASEEGTYAVTGNVVKCSGYIEANATMYIQPIINYSIFTSNNAVRLTSLPFPAADFEGNYGYNTGRNQFNAYFATDVRGGTLGSWCVTDANGNQFAEGAIVGVLDENTNAFGATSPIVNIHFVGRASQLAIASGQFLKFNFEYIKS